MEPQTSEYVKYETGKTVDDVTYDAKGLTVKHHDIEGRDSETRADLVIAANGCNSTIRKKLLAEIKPAYAGYVTWRGLVPEEQVSEEISSALSNKITILRTEDGFIIS
jgi:2-polyprenyl-6-methoxyphenol hydroxylase-like FAD-dependent oxidoreductase